MFTGLVRELGRLDAIATRGSITLLTVSAPATAPGLAVGDSLAVNGICLTVTRISGDRVQVEATPETRRVTTLGRWRRGDRVHLEPSLRVGDSIGGHFVLGHVDGVGRVAAFDRLGGAAVMTVALAPALARELVPKGSIAVDGVSLTLDEGPFADSFSITLVPHTLAVTRFGATAVGDAVNLELDMLAKAARAAVRGSTESASGAGRRATAVPGHGRGGRAGTGAARERTATALTLASLLARGWQAQRVKTK